MRRKLLLIVCCMLTLLFALPEIPVSADEVPEERLKTETPDESLSDETPEAGEAGTFFEADESDAEIVPDDGETEEENVGAGRITVGDGVTAAWDASTGAVSFYSSGGTLWKDWKYQFGENSVIKSVRVASGTVYLPSDSYCIFSGESDCLRELTELDLRGFNTSKVINMNSMFSYCEHLTELDLRSFNTSNVTDMNSMFAYCYSLKELDLSSFDTSRVTDMNGMFCYCCSLENPDLSSFDTSKVTDMCSMFYSCDCLTNLNLRSFDTSRVTNMQYMFSGCNNFETLDLSSFDTSRATDMNGMFSGCEKLTELDLTGFVTSKVTDMNSMFSRCEKLTELDLSSFDTSSVTGMTAMFSGCRDLTSLDLSSFNTTRVTYMNGMFEGCQSLTTLDLSKFNTANVTSMEYMFNECGIRELDVQCFDTSNVTSMEGMFSGCSDLTALDLSHFNTSSVTNMSRMFYCCMQLQDLKLSSFDTTSVTDMSAMFCACRGLKELDLRSFNTSNVDDMHDMFQECYSLITLYLYSFSTENVSSMDYMFRDCTDLVILDISSFDTSMTWEDDSGNNDRCYEMLYGCTSLRYLKSPKKNRSRIDLPAVMYDSSGNEYSEMPDTSQSVILTKEKNGYIADISKCTITLSPKSFAYNGAPCYPKVTVKSGDRALDHVLDYSISYINNAYAGTAQVAVTGIGLCTGEKTASFTIKKADPILDYGIIGAIYKNCFDPPFNIPLARSVTDGRITYRSGNPELARVDKGTGYVTVLKPGDVRIIADAEEGKNYLAGSTYYDLHIEPIHISSVTYQGLPNLSYTYSGKAIKPKVNLSYSNKNLVEGTDYTLEYHNNIYPGTATVIIKGKGVYDGSISDTFKIVPVDISKASVSGISRSYGYSGKAYTPTPVVMVNGVTLKEDRDYSVSYVNNTNPGTATIKITGIGGYTGTRIKTFDIVKCVSSLVSGKTYQLIPKNNSKTAVCSFSGRMVNNTKVYITDRTGSEAMKFKAVKNPDGTWKFINTKCELALAVQQNSSKVGAGTVLYDQTSKPAQNWKLSRKSDNSFAVINSVTGYSIAMSDISAVKGTTLSMAETASSGLQRFYFAETSDVNAEFDGTCAVRASKDKGFSLNITSSSKEDGANANLYSYSNTNAKKFRIMYSGGGYYRLVNVNSGLCLTVSGNAKTDGANAIQSKWAAGSGQRWKITENSDGTVTFTNALGTVLHLVSNKTSNGTNIVAKNASATKAQKWYLN